MRAERDREAGERPAEAIPAVEPAILRACDHIRQLVADIGPLVDDGVSLAVSIDGYETETGQPVSCTGTVTETELATSSAEATNPSLVAGQATLYVETDDGERSVGGWGAIIEDIEATRVIVEDADSPVDLSRTN